MGNVLIKNRGTSNLVH